MRHLKKHNKNTAKVIVSSFKGAPTRILYSVISSNRLFKVTSNLKKAYFNVINKEEATIVVQRKSKEFQTYNEFYASSVLNFLDNLNSSKKYEDLEIIVDSPQKK